MMNTAELEAMNEEARLLYEQILPILDDHSSGAMMLVIAHLFAYWLANHTSQSVHQKALLLNQTALSIYDMMPDETAH
jgi:hypothetical protein